MKRFKGKTALVTGAGRGIGFEIARQLAAEGANVAVTDISEDLAKESAGKIQAETGARTFFLAQDVSKESDCENAVSKTIETFGSLDILVNNAGITRDNLVLRMKEKDFEDVLAVNLKGPFLMAKASFKHMSRKRYGKIINISSVVGQAGQAGQANYSASKAGLIGLTKSLAREFCKRNVNVNAVAPGFIETKMTENLDQKAREEILGNIPLERLGKPEDVAKAVLFLASEESAYITGQILAVNGGIYI
ncbi:MAG: 3-oxoacyl-ACP reductase [Elusimicrobia bacterium CG08_land_8_20_14_0_20_51_18]|nr:MAG: 3-oxoacyl-ACP reductase [Elusimicrobia bacterium CG08_land_8_20_14_0_20_51_18]